MKVSAKLFKREKTLDQDAIIIVSGLPRSGTSMLMKMLEAGGLEPLTDNIRAPDDDNPKGYYEFERVKQLEKDKSWLPEAKGKAVKVISMLLKHLPPEYFYKVTFMQRNMEEILASQKEMLIRRGESGSKVTDEELAEKFHLHLQKIEEWMASQPNFDVIYVKYNEVLQNHRGYCIKINEFLDNRLDVEKMVGAVDDALYRQRR
jgi:broad-specificity NMP kinase